MTATRYALEQRITDDLARNDLSTQITDAVDTAIKAYSDERLAFNEAYRVTATLTSGAVSMSTTLAQGPTRFRKIDRVRLVQSTGTYIDLYRRNYRDIMDSLDGSFSGPPSAFAVYGNTVYFDATADDDYVILFDGVKDLAANSSLSYSTSDTSAWFNDGREIIRHRAKREIYANVLKDYNHAAAAQSAEREAFDNLKGKINDMNGTGFIRPTTF